MPSKDVDWISLEVTTSQLDLRQGVGHFSSRNPKKNHRQIQKNYREIQNFHSKSPPVSWT